ncbi:hypothetical protein DH2020_039832 [Rehmannia glutinosa]|uniref:Late embryogenesis abundant protein LEA-2 subgroup domain-containing protein n=1 Tax=Rehmannia glutinosa TaxID=99300 RepID=A0ABR0UUS7_REHGL
MASSSSSAAASSASNERNRVAGVNPPVAAAVPPPPRAWPIDPPPPPPAVFVQELFRDPDRRRLFLRREALSVLMWLIFHPIFPQLHVISATMSAVAITSTAASAECNITLLLTNPNRHLNTIYDRMQVALLYPSQQVLLSQDYRPPFVQHKKSQTTIEINLSFNGVDLGNDVVKAMKYDLDRGSLSLGIKILAIVRYRNGKWKTKSQFMRAYCGGICSSVIAFWGTRESQTGKLEATAKMRAEHLEMTEDYAVGNLVGRTKAYINEVALKSLAAHDFDFAFFRKPSSHRRK